MEPGVKFFILMLEQLGCRTEWSCEGHPGGFDIVFYGPERVARAIEALGTFSVSLFRGGWLLTLDRAERYSKPWTVRRRNRHMRLNAALWVEQFGPLDGDYPEVLTVDVRDHLAMTTRALVIAAHLHLSPVTEERETSGIEDAIEDAEIALSMYADRHVEREDIEASIADWSCSNCGHTGCEDDFTPEPPYESMRICVECSSTDVGKDEEPTVAIA